MKSKKKETTLTGPPTDIRVSQGAYQKAILKSVLGNFFLALIALLVIYLCFAATVARVVPSSAGFIPLKNNTYGGGVLPKDSQALIVLGEKKAGGGLTDHLMQSFVPQKPSALVSIAAGPVAQNVKWTSGILTVDGRPMPAPIAQDPGIEFLAGDYVAVCIKGDCSPGALVFFKPDQILGIPFAQDAPVPAAPKLDTGKGAGRGNAEQVARDFVLAGYDNEAEYSCSLLEPTYLKKEFKNVDECVRNVELFSSTLGREFDFNTGMLVKVLNDDGKNATVQYNLKRSGVDLGTYKLEMTMTGKGWAITTGAKR